MMVEPVSAINLNGQRMQLILVNLCIFRLVKKTAVRQYCMIRSFKCWGKHFPCSRYWQELEVCYIIQVLSSAVLNLFLMLQQVQWHLLLDGKKQETKVSS
uniref:Uncharacterized protein LOC101493605 isoform X3 n=1 Tax=Cicer arietinum TaxID=3827 RepID=A0A3Q7YEV8_CICAR|nr:uncharacterized protein LOC101493605 isoform X3 [Cicer arietinum]